MNAREWAAFREKITAAIDLTARPEIVVEFRSLYTARVEDIVRRGRVPSLGEIAELERLRAGDDEQIERVRRDFENSIRGPVFREYSPIVSVPACVGALEDI